MNKRFWKWLLRTSVLATIVLVIVTYYLVITFKPIPVTEAVDYPWVTSYDVLPNYGSSDQESPPGSVGSRGEPSVEGVS